ncbi:hypothetical protein G4X40_20110 [Rhodococcus sp. D2-41]|uniref:hypothetical protein n=1 Tax=Speluncibacter jeojiensis TaxID=2710754 RepID=UPI0024105529|nr:hypothetical protein [Rhodococcus sp. D2-41]MDG3012448.1 hypothetical protein [Rhodococcus sp. D2-41]
MGEDQLVPDEATHHPIVIWAAVLVIAVLLIAIGSRKLAAIVSPGWEWWVNRHDRRIQRQIRIEADARLLHDERVGILLDRIDGLTAEIAAQRQELTRQRDEERTRAEAYARELAGVRSQLDKALDEIRALKDAQEV